MATIYNVASGVFSDVIWASSSGGVAGSAGTPGPADSVIFDINSGNVNTNAVYTISQLKLLTGYTGILDLTGFDFLTNLALILESGTLLLPTSGKFECRGITNTIGGTIMPGSTGVLSFIGGTDSVNLLLVNQTFYDVDINKNGPFTFATDLKCTNKIQFITQNTFANTGGKILFTGTDIFTSSNINTASSSFVKLELQSSNNVSITEDIPGRVLPRIVMNKTGGVVTFPLNQRLDSDFGAWETDPLNTGTVDWNGCEYTVRSRGFFAMGNIEFDDLTIDQIGNVTSDGNSIIVNKKLKLVTHNQLTGNYVCKGDIETSVSAESSSNATFDLQGLLAQTVKSINIDSILGGSLVNNKISGKLIVEGQIKVRLNWTDNAFTSIYSGSLKFINNSNAISNSKFSDIEFDALGNCSLNGICNKLTLTKTNIITGDIKIEGDLSHNDTSHPASSTLKITMVGGRGQTMIQGVLADSPNGLFTIQKRRGTVKLKSNINLNDSSFGLPDAVFTPNSVVDLNGFNFNVEDDIAQNGLLDTTNGGTLTTSVGVITPGATSYLGNLNTIKTPNSFNRLVVRTRLRTRRQIERVF